MIYIYLICIAIGLISLVANERIDKFRFVGIIMFVLILIVMVNCDDRMVDLYNYSNTYKRIAANYGEFKFSDFGYYMLQRISTFCGLNFFQFRILVFGVCFGLIYNTAKRYTNNICMFVLFYALFYSVMDGEQLRNFIAFSIIVFGIQFLIDEKKGGVRKYIICNIIAMQFHFMAISYFLFLLLKTSNGIRRIIVKCIPLYLAVMYLVARNGGTLQIILTEISKLGNEEVVRKMSNYSVTSSNWGFLMPCGLYMIECLLILFLNKRQYDTPYYIRHNVFGRNLEITSQKKEVELSKLYYNVFILNIIGCLFIPICMINLTFYRVLRNISMFNLIYMSSKYDREVNKSVRFFIFIFLVLLTLGWQIWDFTIYQEWDDMRQYYFHIV